MMNRTYIASTVVVENDHSSIYLNTIKPKKKIIQKSWQGNFINESLVYQKISIWILNKEDTQSKENL